MQLWQVDSCSSCDSLVCPVKNHQLTNWHSGFVMEHFQRYRGLKSSEHVVRQSIFTVGKFLSMFVVNNAALQNTNPSSADILKAAIPSTSNLPLIFFCSGCKIVPRYEIAPVLAIEWHVDTATNFKPVIIYCTEKLLACNWVGMLCSLEEIKWTKENGTLATKEVSRKFQQ